MSKEIEVLSREVRLTGVNDQDYICLTDIARYKNEEASDDLIRDWLRNRNTVEFLGIWEQINNPGFNPVEFDGTVGWTQQFHPDSQAMDRAHRRHRDPIQGRA